MPIEITVPRLGWSMEEGRFLGWLKHDGDSVKAGEPLFTLENDKAAQDVESIDSGILSIPADAPKAGDVVLVGARLGYLVTVGAGATPAAASVAPPAAAGATASVAPAGAPHGGIASRSAPAAIAAPAASPRARRAAEKTGVDVAAVTGTGAGGRIRERDVLAAGQPAAAARVTGRAAGQPRPTSTRDLAAASLRRTIAERMRASLANTAPVTLTCRADATNLVALRNQFKSAGGQAAVPAYTDIIAKLVAIALESHPALASRWENDRVVLPEAIHIGIAVDTEHGLLVPVIRDVSTLSLAEFARRSRDLIEATRNRRVQADDLQGGTFTITNLGGFGIDAFTPIINYPETAVLGLGAIRPEAVVLADGRVASREQITLSLTFDHRVVDGGPAARFLQSLRQGIENPAAWLLDAAPATAAAQAAR